MKKGLYPSFCASYGHSHGPEFHKIQESLFINNIILCD